MTRRFIKCQSRKEKLVYILDVYTQTRPEDNWIDLHKRIGEPLRAIYSLFDLPSRVIGEGGKKRTVNEKETT